MEGLTDVEAFEIDAGMALRYTKHEEEFQLEMLTAIQASIQNVVQVHSKKKLPKVKRPPKLIVDPVKEPEEPPLVDVIVAALSNNSGKSVVVRK